MSYAMWQAFGDYFDFLCQLKEECYFNFNFNFNFN